MVGAALLLSVLFQIPLISPADKQTIAARLEKYNHNLYLYERESEDQWRMVIEITPEEIGTIRSAVDTRWTWTFWWDSSILLSADVEYKLVATDSNTDTAVFYFGFESNKIIVPEHLPVEMTRRLAFALKNIAFKKTPRPS